MGGSVWGVGLAVRRFLCAGEYIASLIKYERGRPQHPAHEGVKSPRILFMTWRVQGVMNGWLLVFLIKMCLFLYVRRIKPFAVVFGPFQVDIALRFCWWDLGMLV